MKLFLDSAKIEDIRQALSLGVIEGVVVRPGLLPLDSNENKKLARAICREMDGPVGFCVASAETEAMLCEARDLMKIAPNVLVGVPVILDGLKAIHELRQRGIETRAVQVYSVNQALLAAKAGAAFVSPDLGRLDQAGLDGVQVAQDIMTVFRNAELQAQLLLEGVGHGGHVYQAAMVGADAAAVSLDVLLAMLKNPAVAESV